MAKLLKLRRGTTSQHSSFTGAEGEVTVDTDKEVLVVHDGSTAGGHAMAAQDMDNVPAGAILGTQLENSGVTAGQYGSSSAIPIVTVDAQGLVTAASTTAIDSTTIANGSSSVSVANNGAITSNANHDFSAGIDVTGNITATGTITSNGTLTIENEAPGISLNDTSHNPDWQIKNENGLLRVRDVTSSVNRMTIASGGVTTFSGNVDCTSGIDVTGNITSTGDIRVADDKSVFCGASDDFQMIHRTSDNTSILKETGGGDLSLETNGSKVGIYDNSNNRHMAQFITDGACKLNHGATTRLETTSGGATVTGNLAVTGTVDGVDIAARNNLLSGLTSSNGGLINGVIATTQAQSDNSSKVATTAYVRTAITEASPFPSGTKMLFQQTSAPTGWTKQTSGVDNKALRVVSGTAGSGGSNAFSNTLADRSITANSGNATQGGNISVANTTAGGNVSIASATTGGTVSSHTLTVNEIPSHSHGTGLQTFRGNNTNYRNNAAGITSNFINAGTRGWTHAGNATWNNTGGGGGHSHGFTGGSHNHNGTLSGTAHSHNATFTGSAHNHSISVTNLDMAVQYLDVIIAAKD